MAEDPIGEFGDQLDREFLAGRAAQIYEEIWRDFSRLGLKRTKRRLDELVEGSANVVTGLPADDDAIARLLAAHVQAVAENALIAAAIYLARHERPSSPADES